MFIECSLSKEVLQQWVSDWVGESLGMFAEIMLNMLEVHSVSPYEAASLINEYNDNDLRVLSRQCTRFRVPYEKSEIGYTEKNTGDVLAYHSIEFMTTGWAYIPVDFEAYHRLLELDNPALPPQEIQKNGHITLTPPQAFSLMVYDNYDIQSLSYVPRVWEQSNWTPFQQLKAFIARYKRKADAPIWYHDGALRWVIPPVVHSRVKRLVCMSATLQREGFERAFDSMDSENITFIETPPTPFVKDSGAFQVRTGAYPRGSLLEYDSDWQPVGLNKTGAHFLDLIESEVERDRAVRHVLITFNFIAEKYSKSLCEKHSNLDVLSFHKMEGLDYTDSGMVFWILGCPDVSTPVIKQRAQVLYGNGKEPLDYKRNEETREYVDSRVQLCWHAEVAARLQQAVGRARLNRLANTVVVFSNVLIPDFTGRTVGFVPEDLEVAGGLANLGKVAEERMTAEKETEQKTGRERLAAERKSARDTKAEQKTTALSLYGSGVPIDEIAKRVGRNKSTIFRWIEAAKF